VKVGFNPLQHGVRLAHDARDIWFLPKEKYEQNFDSDQTSRKLDV